MNNIFLDIDKTKNIWIYMNICGNKIVLIENSFTRILKSMVRYTLQYKNILITRRE